MPKATEKSGSKTLTASSIKHSGVLTPGEWAAAMIIAGFPKNAKIISEGLGTIKSESSFNASNMVQGPSGHIGGWSEEPGFGSVADRLDPIKSSEAALKNWKENGNSFYQAWGQYETGEIAGGGAAGYGPEYLKTAEEVIATGVSSETNTNNATGANTATGGVSLANVEAIAKAAAFSTYLNLPSALEQAESLALKGERSLMNDKPLLPFIEQLCTASLRRFQSMPNGNFFAFYPDYFGGMEHRTPYWSINDIEIIDGHIQLSDEPLATHVYVVGDTVGYYDGITVEDQVASAGVVTLFEAMAANFITGLEPGRGKDAEKKNLTSKDEVINFMKKYGARPYYEEAPMVRSGYYEMFLAFQRFCMLWSSQFKTTFQLTYMPELFPGGLVELPEHQLQLFVEEVSHDFDYESGFTTTAVFSSPTSLPGGPAGIHDGLIRADALTDNK